LISQIELVNTNSRNFGQMSNRLRIQESQSTILDISDSEAAELERLGRLLAGKSAYWGDDGESD